MALFLNDGLDDLTRLMLQIDNTATYVLRLYVNNYTPTCASVLSNFTECNLAGYAAKTLSPSQWTGDTVSCISQYSYPTQTWTFDSYTASQNTVIYGWYLENTDTSNVILAEQFATPYTVPYEGGQVLLTLTWNDQNC